MTYLLRDLRYQQVVRTSNELRDHLESFHLEPKFSVGIWYFAPGGGRFHDRYVPEMTIQERLDIAAQDLAPLGITGIEAHYPAEIRLS